MTFLAAYYDRSRLAELADQLRRLRAFRERPAEMSVCPRGGLDHYVHGLRQQVRLTVA